MSSNEHKELPYEFDLLWDIKTYEQLRDKLKELQALGGELKSLQESMERHNIFVHVVECEEEEEETKASPLIVYWLGDCARCGKEHADLPFTKLTFPVLEDDKILYTHWSPCPTNGEPVLLIVVDLEDSNLEKAQQ